jgi:hypothetical protein
LFNSNGRCIYLFTPDKTGKRDTFDFGDNIPPTNTWKVQGDSLLFILGLERKVLHFSDDSILLINTVTNEVDTLIKNCK